MPDFPENEIEILPDFLSEELNELWEPMRTGLHDTARRITSPITEPNAHRVDQTLLNQILSTRQQLNQFLSHEDNLKGLGTAFGTVQTTFKRRAFGDALGTIVGLTEFDSVPRISALGDAFHATPVFFDQVIEENEEDPGGHHGGKPTKVVHNWLRRYKGPSPTPEQRRKILAWSAFLSNETDQRFQVGLLQAEANVGLRVFDGDHGAIALYHKLLGALPSGSPRHKFVAIRAAFAHLARGDQLFRKQRTLSDQDREKSADDYDAAVRLLQEAGVSPDNPRRQEVEAQASQQKAKLQSGLNFLGLWDAFVPVQTLPKLQESAHAQITLAKEAEHEFQTFLENAETEGEKQKDVEFQQADEQSNLDNILSRRQENATLSGQKIDEQLSAIDDQLSFLSGVEDLGSGAFKAIVEGLVTKKQGAGTPLGLATAGAGAAGVLVNFLAQRSQLGHQQRTAEIEKGIANNEALIAQAESDMSNKRIEFYKQKLDFLQNKRLNADFLYLLAEIKERRAERLLEVAILLAYLFERALAFFLGEPNIRPIQFNYLDRRAGIFDAINDLEKDLRDAEREFDKVTEEKFDFFEEIISLRESYPIEFNRFLQTGKMDFVYSLYQLSKRRPATHQCRLKEVGVEVVGLLPPTGFSGLLTHHGRFLVRDKIATLLDPEATRLVPTDEQLAQALKEQRRLGLPVAAVGGVLYYDLVPDPKELSVHTQFVSQVPPDQFTLGLFEGYGPTGLWTLEIREHGQLAISDILLHFAIVSRKSDPFALEPKIRTLIRSYEAELAQGDQLDRFSVFSLRQQFPDTFFALQTGLAALSLGEENFPSGLTHLQFKMVIAQALDPQGKGVPGVALEIGRQDVGFNQARVTRSDGFSEDLDAPPQTLPRDQHFPVIGAWQIRLSNPTQFAQLGDLRAFFMYAFEEV